MTRPLIATYRMQLRNGLDFHGAREFFPVLADYGISHLYLSPIFTAQSGSTHGYDITDPNEIDPALGGREAFEEFAKAAADAGLGIVLDIVPNHTAFSTENPWLRDVLRRGADSDFARHFDIDYSRPLILPFLGKPFEEYAEAGEVAVAQDDGGPVMEVGGVRVPLAKQDGGGQAEGVLPAEAAAALHEAQDWRLTPWTFERDSVSHRRFFNVTGLIGMRVDDPRVFDDMHELIFDLVGKGLVHGLRVDHVDGLADPGGYLIHLRERVGDIPIWIEKILTGDEDLPDWPVTGTTGYEAAQKIAQVLTRKSGHDVLVRRWAAKTGEEGDFHKAVADAKVEVLRNELAAELHQLIALADACFEKTGELHGPEALREAVIALLVAFPRYRSYLTTGTASDDDLTLWRKVRDEAAETVRLPDTIEAMHRLITEPDMPEAHALQERFQQVTGAVLAKAHEDTAGFRWTPYLASNEVGADPDHPVVTAEEFEAWLKAREPWGLTLTSSHDTKRSEDARMRLVSISHMPEAFLDLWQSARSLHHARDADPSLAWYLVQSALAIWQPGADGLAERLGDHMIKAAREGKAVSNWTAPDEEAEGELVNLAHALLAMWRESPPGALSELIALGERLSLVQLALKGVMPGVPDFYGEAFGAHFALTDPDNRSPVSPGDLERVAEDPGFSGRKARLTRKLLDLRRETPDFFAEADVSFLNDNGTARLCRRTGDRRVSLWFRRDAADLSNSGTDGLHVIFADGPVAITAESG